MVNIRLADDEKLLALFYLCIYISISVLFQVCSSRFSLRSLLLGRKSSPEDPVELELDFIDRDNGEERPKVVLAVRGLMCYSLKSFFGE